VDEAVGIAREVADALAHAHERELIHRDIKPENILLEGGHALVAHFGIARAVGSAATTQLTTATGLAIGTPAYMSPEQALGDAAVDGRSDVYALGCVLYEMLVGEPPHTGPTAQAIVARRLSEPVRSLRQGAGATGERKYHLTNHPPRTARRRLAAAIKARWSCEQAHQQLKEELGLDHFEGRTWRGLHHHTLLTLISFAFLQHLRLDAIRRRGKNRSPGPRPAARADAADDPPRARHPRPRRPPALPDLPRAAGVPAARTSVDVAK
jgi:serine/threonine protein kinase